MTLQINDRAVTVSKDRVKPAHMANRNIQEELKPYVTVSRCLPQQELPVIEPPADPELPQEAPLVQVPLQEPPVVTTKSGRRVHFTARFNDFEK
jgi:hypothetical protein